MRLQFAHPRSAALLEAEVEPWFTGEETVQALVKAGFIQQPQAGRAYELVIARTRQQITPNMTFGESQLIEGEVIEVFQAGLGA
jgi:hypothetical protein